MIMVNIILKRQHRSYQTMCTYGNETSGKTCQPKTPGTGAIPGIIYLKMFNRCNASSSRAGTYGIADRLIFTRHCPLLGVENGCNRDLQNKNMDNQHYIKGNSESDYDDEDVIVFLTSENNEDFDEFSEDLKGFKQDYSDEIYKQIADYWKDNNLSYSVDYTEYLPEELPTQVGGTCHQYAELINITAQYNIARGNKRSGTPNKPVAFDINDYFQARNFGILSKANYVKDKKSTCNGPDLAWWGALYGLHKIREAKLYQDPTVQNYKPGRAADTIARKCKDEWNSRYCGSKHGNKVKTGDCASQRLVSNNIDHALSKNTNKNAVFANGKFELYGNQKS